MDHLHHSLVSLKVLLFSVGLALSVSLFSCAPRQHFEIINPSANIVEIPIDLTSGAPLVTVTIEGKNIPLLLDLGGFSTISLTDSILNLLQPEYTGKKREFVDAFGQAFTVRDYILPECTVGSLTLKNIEATEDKFNQRVPTGAKNGYVGLGFLSHFTVILDYPAKKLVLIKEGESLPKEYQNIEWSFEKFWGMGVRSHLVIDGEEKEFVWDTGASHSIIRSDAVKRERIANESGRPMFYANNLEAGTDLIGPLDFIVLDFDEPKVDGIIGHNFFEKHVVIINFDTKKVCTD